MLKLSVTVAVTIYCAVCVLMYIMQRSLLYFPTAPAVNISEKAVTFHNGEVSLQGWVLNPGHSKAIVYFAGNAEQIEHNIAFFKRNFADISVYLVNYRGYGNSSGQPTEAGLFSDALAIYDQIKTHHPDITVMGRSLGTAVATYLAANRAVSHLILVTPFDSIVNVAQQNYPLLPVSLLLKDKYESWKLTKQINSQTSTKVLIVIAELDRIVPPAHAKQLLSHFNEGKTDGNSISVATITGAQHNNIAAYPAYLQAISTFLDEH